jgi:hypothetical protein
MSVKTIFQRSRLLGAVLAGLLLVACSPAKDPAQMAIADAQAAVNRISADGQKFAPTEFANVTGQLAAMKAAFDKGEYESVLNMVHKLGPDLRVLAEAVQDRKSEAAKALKVQWSNMQRDFPPSLAAVEAKVTELNKTQKLPKGVSKDTLAGAGADLDAAKQSWSEAQTARTAKNFEDAVAKGKAADAKVAALMESLHIPAPKPAAK